MKIPKDVDDLMWELSECGDERAMQEFVQRYPQYRAELNKRASMVSGLKGAKTKPQEASAIPRFTPRSAPQPQPMSRWIPVAACLVLAVMAYASYRITAGYVSEATKPKYIAAPRSEGLPDRQERITPKLPESVDNNRSIAGNNPAAAPSSEKPITIKIDRAPLITVLDMVATESGIVLEVGPNMDNPDIKMEYVQVPGSQILGDLGRAFGFTALKEGENRYLIVPAIDPSKKAASEERLGIAELLEPSRP